MKKYLLLTLLISSTILINAQTWDGGGDGTSWNDALNWDNDAVPAINDIVTINADVTITGTATNNPSRVVIGSNSTVTFSLDLAIGDGVELQHALKVQGNATLNLGSGAGESFTINTSVDRDGIQHNATGTPANIIIASGSTLTISQARDGISFTGTGSNTIVNNGTIDITGASRDGILVKSGSFTNNGIVNINSANQDGIDNEATFNNNGTLSIVDANSNGVNNRATGTFNNFDDITITNPSATTTDGIASLGFFNNSVSGVITSTKMDDDCIELTGGVFTNDGTINVTVEDAANSANNGISIGTASAAATFTNSSNNSVNADGGISPDGRAIYVYEMGTLTNTGTMTLSGGNTGATLYTRGLTNNEEGATIDLGDGRINVNQGTLTNDGFIESTRTSPSVFNTATANNNGFFKYDSSVGNFATGSGTTNDLGINLNQSGDTNIDLGGSCSVKLANTSYTWYSEGEIVGTSDVNGNLTLPDGFFTADPAVLTLNEYPDVLITINNICAQALPILLTSFEAKVRNKEVVLDWITETEINSDYIAVERRTSSTDWVTVDEVATLGNSNRKQHYQYIDKNIGSGDLYYRLRMVDFDGYFEYSEVRQVSLGTSFEQVSVYPTVVSRDEFINIDLSEINDQEVSITVYNLQGVNFHMKKYDSDQILSISSADLLSGLNIVSIAGDDFFQSHKIFVVE